MKNMYSLDPKAYKEGYCVLKLLSKNKQKKIPKDKWNLIENKMDSEYKISYKDIYSGNLLDDTNLLLAIIYKAYLATDEEKRVIKAKEDSLTKKRKAKK